MLTPIQVKFWNIIKAMFSKIDHLLKFLPVIPESWSRNPKVWFVAWLVVLLLALGLRISGYWLDPIMSRDSARYLLMAEEWLEAGSFENFFIQEGHITVAPLWLLVLKCCISIGISPEFCGIAINIISGVLIVAAIGVLTMVLTESRFMALLSGFLAAIHPTLIQYSIMLQRENLYLLATILFLICFFKTATTKKMSYLIGAGAFAMLAFLTRFEALELNFLILAALIIWLYQGTMPRLRLLFYIVVGYGGIQLVVYVVFCLMARIPILFAPEALIRKIMEQSLSL